jgi:hypothetical protein
MNSFLAFLKDPNDQLSSKRLVGLGAWVNATAFIWIFVALGKLPAEVGLNAFLMMLAAGVLGATLDHWGK